VARALVMATTMGSMIAAGDACVVNPTATQFSSADNCPPYILTDRAAPPTTQIAVPPVSDPTVASPSFQVDSVPIQTCAEAKTFLGRIFLDGKSVIFQEFNIPPEVGSIRSAKFSVPIVGTLGAGCHLVELYVSSAFTPGDVRAPATPGDLATIAWFVYVHAPSDPDSPITGCNR
jgi:hypothetical protein